MGLNNEIFLGHGSNFNIQSTQTVELRESLVLMTPNDNSISLDVKITADLNSIPPEYHEVFLNMLTSKYYGRVSFGDNPFSQCLPPKKKKWYEFWKK
jgi:hypothetical protein